MLQSLAQAEAARDAREVMKEEMRLRHVAQRIPSIGSFLPSFRATAIFKVVCSASHRMKSLPAKHREGARQTHHESMLQEGARAGAEASKGKS